MTDHKLENGTPFSPDLEKLKEHMAELGWKICGTTATRRYPEKPPCPPAALAAAVQNPTVQAAIAKYLEAEWTRRAEAALYPVHVLQADETTQTKCVAKFRTPWPPSVPKGVDLSRDVASDAEWIQLREAKAEIAELRRRITLTQETADNYCKQTKRENETLKMCNSNQYYLILQMRAEIEKLKHQIGVDSATVDIAHDPAQTVVEVVGKVTAPTDIRVELESHNIDSQKNNNLLTCAPEFPNQLGMAAHLNRGET